jgi:hypothetical protein
MTIDSPNITRVDDTDAVLSIAASIIDKSGCVEMLEEGRAPKTYDGAKRGPKPRYAAYPIRLLLIATFELVFRGTPTIVWGTIGDSIWRRYTEQQLAALGYAGWRDVERQQAFGKMPGTTPPSSQTEQKEQERLWNNEVNRLAEQFRRALGPMDTTVGSGNVRQTPEVLEAARLDPAFAAKDDLAHDVLNSIGVLGSLRTLQQTFFPHADPDDLLGGVLLGFAGHVGADEHICATTLGLGRGNTTPCRQYSKSHGHHRRYKGADAFGLSVVVATPKARTPLLPSLALGLTIGAPSTGSGPAVLRALDSMTKNGLRPERRGRSRHFVALDMGYPGAAGLNAALIDRGLAMLTMYPERWTQGIDLRDGVRLSTKRRADLETTDLPLGGGGPYLFNGCVVCPAAKATIDRIARKAPRGDSRESRRWEPPAPKSENRGLLHLHDEEERILRAAAMPLNGAPVPVKHTTSGRPKKDQQPVSGAYRVQVSCPAAAGQARCPRVPASLNLSRDVAPTFTELPDGPMSTVCAHNQVSLELDADRIKRWQPLMAGSWEHNDLYKPYRSDTERFFATLTSPSGANRTIHQIGPYANAINVLVTAFAIATANYRNYERFVSRHAIHSAPGSPLRFPKREVSRQSQRRKEILQGSRRAA